MKTVIVQVTREYLCLTCCEPIIQAKDQKKEATVDLSYRFTAPYVKPLDTKYMEGKDTVWEIPKAFATMVNDGLREMKRPEVKEVILLVEDFDLVSSEFQHVRCKKKMLDNIAVENLKEVLQDDVKQFSVITTTYGTPPKEVPEMTSKTFGIPRALSAELAKRFSEMGLTLIKITPADVPLLKIAREIVYSFNKTVCYISIDYAALRVTLVKDSLPLYCHTFHSPITEAVDIIMQDRQLTIPQAIDYIKQNGFDLEYDSRNESSRQRIKNVREDLMADVVHNINLVAMSLDLNIDQVVVSDVVGFFPRVTNTIKKMGISLDVDLISDQFNTKMAVPELDIDARDSGFKTGSFILYNNLLNCGDKYKNNLMVGLQPLKEKSLNIGKQASIIFAALVGVSIVVAGGYYAFLNIQKSMDEAKLKEDKYVQAKDLLARQEAIQTKLKNQVSDSKNLPKTPLYVSDTFEQVKKQVADKTKNFSGYNLTYDPSTQNKKDFKITVPVNASIGSFKDFLALKDKITEDGFFTVSESFSMSESGNKETSSGYDFNITLANVIDTEEEEAAFANISNTKSAANTVASAQNATEKATSK